LTSYWQEIVGWYFLLARSVQRPNSAQYPIWDGRVLRGVSHAQPPTQGALPQRSQYLRRTLCTSKSLNLQRPNSVW